MTVVSLDLQRAVRDLDALVKPLIEHPMTPGLQRQALVEALGGLRELAEADRRAP